MRSKVVVDSALSLKAGAHGAAVNNPLPLDGGGGPDARSRDLIHGDATAEARKPATPQLDDRHGNSRRGLGRGWASLDRTDRAIIVATQAGLPLTPRPYHDVGVRIGVSGEEVMARMQAMLNRGLIRRIGAVPNHYALGYHANGMSVWDVADEHVDLLGEQVGALEFVSHCYRRPRHLPEWPYNLFAMVHGRSREEVADKISRIAELLGNAARGHEVLYSTRILKKTGLRLPHSNPPPRAGEGEGGGEPPAVPQSRLQRSVDPRC